MSVTMSKDRQTVLILSSDPAFSRAITANWPQDTKNSSKDPDFIVLDKGFSHELNGDHYDLAIADAACCKNQKVGNRSLDYRALKDSISAAGKPAILIHAGSLPEPSNSGAVIELSREDSSWSMIAGLLAHEILRRRRAEERAREAEDISVSASAEATLGRYMVEMRTNVNNALTTVLGNAELLALEPGLPGNVRAQADTIRNMALRLHEVFQRFSSIEKELNVAARESGKKVMAAASGR
jgi:hypothetical protein